MNRKRLLLVGALAAVILLADQATKIWARATLRGGAPIVLSQDYLRLEYFENTGMAFSLGRDMPGARFIFVALGVVILVLVWRTMRHLTQLQRVADVAFGLVVGGAVGNLIDRVYLGFVVDFVVMHWRHQYSWPAYNVADAALVVGVALLLVAMLRNPTPEAVKADKTSSKKK